MRALLFKMIMILAGFAFLAGAIIPWVVSNNLLPLWLDILIMSAILMGWGILIEKISLVLKRKFWSEDDDNR